MEGSKESEVIASVMGGHLIVQTDVKQIGLGLSKKYSNCFYDTKSGNVSQ